jgi:hypothetical protein
VSCTTPQGLPAGLCYPGYVAWLCYTGAQLCRRGALNRVRRKSPTMQPPSLFPVRSPFIPWLVLYGAAGCGVVTFFSQKRYAEAALALILFALTLYPCVLPLGLLRWRRTQSGSVRELHVLATLSPYIDILLGAALLVLAVPPPRPSAVLGLLFTIGGILLVALLLWSWALFQAFSVQPSSQAPHHQDTP